VIVGGAREGVSVNRPCVLRSPIGAALVLALLASVVAGRAAAADGGGAPSLETLAPEVLTAGSGAFTLTLGGSGFRDGDVVLWDGNPRETTFVSTGSMTAAIAAADVTDPATHDVAVRATNGRTSNSLSFTVHDRVAVPTVLAPTAGLHYRSSAWSYTVRWSETNPGSIANRLLTEQSAPNDVNGACSLVTWEVAWAIQVTSGYRVEGFTANRCYRWIVTLTNRDGVARRATTGILRIVPQWTGTYNLARTGAFSTQKTWTWCTAAAVQMILNIVRGASDHSKAGQQAIYTYERKHDRYPSWVEGSDPQGMAAALRHYAAGNYQVSKTSRYSASLHAAVRRMRLTGKPVGAFVSAGNHAWMINGFSATADPATTNSFTVTAVYVMGPLWPMQSYRYGYYDPRPNTRYTASQFSRVLTRYYDSAAHGKYSIWQGSYVTVNP
jgi:hypothetical protein